MSWLVWRICKGCGMKFRIDHTPGEKLPEVCEACRLPDRASGSTPC